MSPETAPEGLYQETKLAERTGLEPATPDVTGRYSNQLNYHSSKCGHYMFGGGR
jgi:hypothetical protein